MKMTNRELETRYMHMKQTWKTLVDANVTLVDENKDLKEEIERLKEDNKYLNKVNIELYTEKNRLNNIINEAIELTNKIIEAGWDYDEKDTLAIKLEEILDKTN